MSVCRVTLLRYADFGEFTDDLRGKLGVWLSLGGTINDLTMGFFGMISGFYSLVFDKIRMEYVWWVTRRANRKRFREWQGSIKDKMN